MQVQYTISVSFSTDKKLDTTEIEALCTQVAAQVEEPVTIYGEDVEYQAELLTIQIEKNKEEE
jgi:hypothetical protein